MEIFILSFAAGIAATMIVVALVEDFSHVFVALILVGLLLLLWYGWAIFGAEFVADYWNNRTDLRGAKDAPTKLEALGQVGDLFGGINALFAALAFGGVILAAMIQSRTLALTSKQHAQQSFEPLFFQLLDLHRKVSATQLNLRSAATKSGSPISKTAVASVPFERAVTLLRRALRLRAVGLRSPADGGRLEASAKLIYSAFYQINQDELGPHFRSLYHVFKLIEGANLGEGPKVVYANIARATLGKDQLFLLAINCLSDYGKEFKPLVERYGLLKHVDRKRTSSNIDERLAIWCYLPAATQSAMERKRSLGQA